MDVGSVMVSTGAMSMAVCQLFLAGFAQFNYLNSKGKGFPSQLVVEVCLNN
jgi:hypothetical protein